LLGYDSDLVCQPCYDVSENHFDNFRRVQNDVHDTGQHNTHDDNAITHDDNAIIDDNNAIIDDDNAIIHDNNAIIDTYQLQSQITRNLLFWQCVQEQLNQNALTSSMNLVDINVTKIAFACIITVQCKHGHSFSIEPAHIPIQKETNPNTNNNMVTELQHNDNNNASNSVNNEEEYATTDHEVLEDHVTANTNKRKGRPPSTYQIHDFSINYMAFILIQLFGSGVTALDTVLGMLGLGVHCGSHCSWAVVMNHCGEAQQK